MPRPLTSSFVHSRDASEELLREVWRLRLEFLTLTRTEEQDWEQFRDAVVGDDRYLFVFTDPEGVAQGFFTIALLPVDVTSRRMLLMFSKFFYFRREYRGHPKTVLAPWQLVPVALRTHGLRSLHFVTTAFPQSYVSLTRTSGRTWSLRQDDTPTWAREALVEFASTFHPGTFDPESGLVHGANVADSESVARSKEAQELAERYEELNPRWREGITLPILFSVDPRLIKHNTVRTVRRMLRR